VEKQYNSNTYNGIQVTLDDLNSMGENGALADDRVFAELLRMPPMAGSNVSRGILTATHGGALVAPNGATGSVLVAPFRAFIGSRTAEATDPKLSYRDARSQLAVGAGATRGQVVSFAANASGQPRWDLVYAMIEPDEWDASLVRKVKSPATKVVSGAASLIYKNTNVILGTVAGTAAAFPTTPAAPADTSTEFYIPLAYVRVPNGFGSGSTVSELDIAVIAPCLALATATGAASFRVANAHHAIGGSMHPTVDSWGANNAAKPAMWIGSNLVGEETIMVAMNLATGSETIASGGIIDDSRDWRGRICRWQALVTDVAAPFAFAFEGAGGGGYPAGTDLPNLINEWVVAHGMGSTAGAPVSTGRVARLNGDRMNFLTNGSFVYLDHDSSGRLVVTYSGGPAARVIFFLTFTPRFDINVL
jgi:hypothetical protein